MKSKKIIAVVVALTIASTLMISCGKKSNETSTIDTSTVTSETSTSDTNTGSSETSTVDTNTDDKVEASTVDTNTDDKVEASTSTEEPPIKVDKAEELVKDNTVGDAFYLVIDIDPNQEDLQGEVLDLADKSGVTNRDVISNMDQKDGNVLVGLYSDKLLKNIKLYDIDSEKLVAVNNDYATYVKDSLDGTKSSDIVETLENTQFLGIKCKVSGDSAEQILVWENEGGEKQYLPIYFK